MQNLKVVAVASSEETRSALYSQLQGLDYIDFDGVVLELSDAAMKCQQAAPDIIVIDLTGRELDGGLFMQTISMNPDSPCTIFALHRTLDHQTILDAVKNGAKEFIQYPDEEEKLELALRKYLAMINRGKQEPSQPKEKGQLITVFSAKGGSGCSTVAVNLAYELGEQDGASVVLFDLDQVFSNTAVMLNLNPSYAVGDLSDTNPDELDIQLMKRIPVAHESGLHVVVGSKSVLDDHDMISPELLERTVSFLADHYTHVVVDLPTHVLDPYHQYMIERSDLILLVASLDIPSLSRTRQYLDLARQYLDMGKVKLVMNRWTRKAAYGMSNESVEEQFGYPIFARLPNNWELNVEANSLGCVLAKVKPNDELVKAIRQLASMVSGENVQAEPSEEKGGLLGKLFTGIKKKGSPTDVIRKTELG